LGIRLQYNSHTCCGNGSLKPDGGFYGYGLELPIRGAEFVAFAEEIGCPFLS